MSFGGLDGMQRIGREGGRCSVMVEGSAAVAITKASSELLMADRGKHTLCQRVLDADFTLR